MSENVVHYNLNIRVMAYDIDFFFTMQGYVKGEVVPVEDIKLGSRCRCVISFVFQAHFVSEERVPSTH